MRKKSPFSDYTFQLSHHIIVLVHKHYKWTFYSCVNKLSFPRKLQPCFIVTVYFASLGFQFSSCFAQVQVCFGVVCLPKVLLLLCIVHKVLVGECFFPAASSAGFMCFDHCGDLFVLMVFSVIFSRLW